MDTLKILFTGDFCPHLRIEQLISEERYDLIFNEFKSELDGNDLNIVDLECPLTESNVKIHKTGPHLKASPKAVHTLKFANVGLVAMANNHIRDYGEQGILDTLQYCEAEGIHTVGVGKTLTEARRPFSFERKDMKVAILNIAENEWSNTQGNEVGANPLDLVKNFQDIQTAKAEHDFVIIVYHGGNEFYELPSPRLKETLRFFIDAGAHAVIAHHTHIVSGYEVYKEAPIFYSLGNFCFDWPDQRNSFWNIGFAVRLKLTKSKDVEFEILPFKQNDKVAGVHPLSLNEREAFDQNIIRLNSTIANDHTLDAEFHKYCKEKEIFYRIYLEPHRSKLFSSLYKRRLIPSLLSTQKKRLYLNIMRCESHRDVLLQILKQGSV